MATNLRNIVSYLCVCLFVLVQIRRCKSDELNVNVDKSEHSPQTSKGSILQENVEEILYKAETDDVTNLKRVCTVPQQPENGYITNEHTQIGSVIHAKCHSGFRLRGPETITCLLVNGETRWSPDERVACIAESDVGSLPSTKSEVPKNVHAAESQVKVNGSVPSPFSQHPAEHQPPEPKRRDRHHVQHLSNKAHPEAVLGREKQVGLPSHCEYRPDVGSCGASHKRYYFSMASKECHTFFYGGCEGNDNNFATMTDCNLACLGHE